MTKRRLQTTPGLGILRALDVAQRSGRHDFAAVNSGARAKIDNVIRAPHRFFVVLDDDERVSFFAQRRQRVEQAQIIARMQTDGRLVEHVKDAAQIRAELRRQANPLRFAAAQRFGRTPEREITEPDVLHETQTLLNFRNEIGRDGLLRSAEFQLVDLLRGFRWPKDCELIDGVALHAHVARDRVQARAVAPRTFVRFIFVDPFRFALGRKFVFQNRIAVVAFARLQILVPDFAEPAAFLHAPCGELNENKRGSSSSKARPQPGQLISVLMTVSRFFESSRCAVPRPISSARCVRLRAFKIRFASITPTTTSMVCSLKRSSFRNCETGMSVAIDIKRVESLALGPARDIGVKTFARFDQRREHFERAAFRRGLNLFHDRGQTLLFDRQIAVRTKLRSGFGEEQSKKMINFRHRRDGRFAAAARDALLDRDTRRQTGDKIDIGFFELLDKLPRIRRHAVEKSALPFREKNVERERRFSRTAQSGDHHHLVARNFDVDVFQIVLARAMDADCAIAAVNSETRRAFAARAAFAVILSARRLQS